MWASALARQAWGRCRDTLRLFPVGPVYPSGAWAYGRLDWLRRDLGAILASPYAHTLIGYYYDNESPTQFVLATQVLSLVASLDRQGVCVSGDLHPPGQLGPGTGVQCLRRHHGHIPAGARPAATSDASIFMDRQVQWSSARFSKSRARRSPACAHKSCLSLGPEHMR